MAAQSLTRMFSGQGASEQWCPLAVTIGADIAGLEPKPPNGHYERDFQDGRVRLESGRPGTLLVDERHSAPAHLLPQCLNLLLAQQWARCGLMTVHGAAFRFGRQGVLAVGPKAAGKSVLTVAAEAAGGWVISDDWLLMCQANKEIRAERLRGFLMLRDSWAAGKLGALERFRPNPDRPKRIKPIPVHSDLYPVASKIDQVWLLSRPRGGRRAASSIIPAQPTKVLATLISAGMPILMTASFPHEHRELMRMLQKCISSTQQFSVQTGLDLVEDPKGTLARLTGQPNLRRHE